MKKQKPRINHKIFESQKEIFSMVKDGKEILKMSVSQIVKKFGKSGHIILPNSLVGKQIFIIYDPNYKMEAGA